MRSNRTSGGESKMANCRSSLRRSASWCDMQTGPRVKLQLFSLHYFRNFRSLLLVFTGSRRLQQFVQFGEESAAFEDLLGQGAVFQIPPDYAARIDDKDSRKVEAAGLSRHPVDIGGGDLA